MRPMIVFVLGVVAFLVVAALAAPEAAAQGMEIATKIGPDLVIQEIIIRQEGSEEFHNARIDVKVRNIGGADAGASVTALVYCRDAALTPLVLTQATPAVAKGAVRDLEFQIEGISGRLGGLLMAIADVPVAAHPVGQVAEGSRLIMLPATAQRIDLNNTFGAIFTTEGRTLPLRLQNPLVN